MHSYVITEAVIMNSDFWFASELQDIFFPVNAGVPGLISPAGLLSLWSSHAAADIDFHCRDGWQILFQKTPYKQMLSGTSQNTDL